MHIWLITILIKDSGNILKLIIAVCLYVDTSTYGLLVNLCPCCSDILYMDEEEQECQHVEAESGFITVLFANLAKIN